MKTQELLTEFGMGRSAFMTRLAKLKEFHQFEPSKDSAGHIDTTPEETEVLRDLDKHLKNKGTVENFVMRSPVSVASNSVRQPPDIPSDSNRALAAKTSNNGHLTPSDAVGDPVLDMAQLAYALAKQIDPLSHWKQLEWAIANKVKLSTKEVHQLIGTKPSGAKFDRGSYSFVRSGKIGGQSAWKVEKLQEEQ